MYKEEHQISEAYLHAIFEKSGASTSHMYFTRSPSLTDRGGECAIDTFGASVTDEHA